MATIPELTPQLLLELWTEGKANRPSKDHGKLLLQKFILLHENLHPLWEKLERDPATPLVQDGENLVLHIAFDARTELALMEGNPPGLREVFESMTNAGAEPGMAFHILAQAHLHECLEAGARGHATYDPKKFLARAQEYAKQVLADVKAGKFPVERKRPPQGA